jgi:hypothetical protein
VSMTRVGLDREFSILPAVNEVNDLSAVHSAEGATLFRPCIIDCKNSTALRGCWRKERVARLERAPARPASSTVL